MVAFKSASLSYVDVLEGRAPDHMQRSIYHSVPLGKDGDYLQEELLNLWSMNDLLVSR